jgi:DNA-binding NarL/FixJ family response regulator
MTRRKTLDADYLKAFPPLPLDDAHWRAIVEAMGLPPQLAKTAELVLRGLCDKQISTAMGIGEPTIRTYLQRIAEHAGGRGRMALARHVLGVSHALDTNRPCHQK